MSAHPDEAVQPVDQVPSPLVAEAVIRHEAAQGDGATEQEKKQAAVEQAHALGTRPQGSYAQLHEVTPQPGHDGPVLAVPDEGHAKSLQEAQAAQERADAEELRAAQQAAEAAEKGEPVGDKPAAQEKSAAEKSRAAGQAAAK